MVLARVVIHVLARVLLHVLARVIIHVHDYYSKTCTLDASVTSERQTTTDLLSNQVQIWSLCFHRWKQCLSLTENSCFSALTCQGRWVPEQSADGVQDSLNRAQASLPLHKQSVGRWTPGRCDVGEERKYFWSLKEKWETTFKAKKSDMSISPPCASPLERVHSTRARFVRAKPDPVLRFRGFFKQFLVTSVTENWFSVFQHWASSRCSSCHGNKIFARGEKTF